MRVLNALSQAVKCRNGVFDDQGQVRGCGADKSDIGQLNEVLCKVLCHNLCVLIQAIHELGIEPTFETSLVEKPKSLLPH